VTHGSDFNLGGRHQYPSIKIRPPPCACIPPSRHLCLTVLCKIPESNKVMVSRGPAHFGVTQSPLFSTVRAHPFLIRHTIYACLCSQGHFHCFLTLISAVLGRFPSPISLAISPPFGTYVCSARVRPSAVPLPSYKLISGTPRSYPHPALPAFLLRT
jgi:hypothetical protein